MTKKTALWLLMLMAVCSVFFLSGCEKQEFALALVTPQSISESDAAHLCYDGVTRFAEENSLSVTAYSGECTAAIEEAVQNGAKEIVLLDVDEQEAEQAILSNPLVDFYCLDFSGDFSVRANTYCVDIDKCSLGFLAGYASVMDGRTVLGVQCSGDDGEYACGFVAGAGSAAKEKELKKESVKIWYDVSGSDMLTKRIDSWEKAGCQAVFCSDELALSVYGAISDSDACAVISQRANGKTKTAAAIVKRYDEMIYQALSLTRENGFFPGGTVKEYEANGTECTLEINSRILRSVSESDIAAATDALASGEAAISSINQPQKNANKYISFSMPGIIIPDEKKTEEE